ncbi:predicted protein [Scheffersomyces stipitis CBS 6054]|uniref:Glycine zipper 2TM domain-containing protein n=1 Tax=Scheffersomyces stipitis (strain ATCC 58785 / CBS 6054 / NBRC 10063 / NRRL Y-11545) TaxID=322104 RepID=A3LPX4_PICST|nr:predicted protein [Scheffersomyces stipitis CBS 6054]ABN65115.2 predicted protein [Scheffersomyces stipitis CBS 6054]KAG2736041.1 hypothetical protein G9P44_000131 [Scheffersomyces stipitis]
MSANDFYSSGEQGEYKPQQSKNQQGGDGQTGDRGLISTVVGGAAGGYAGDKLVPNHPHLGALAGVIGGAIGANKLEDAYEDHKQNKDDENKHGGSSGFGGRGDDRRSEGAHGGQGGFGGERRGEGAHGGQGGFGGERRGEGAHGGQGGFGGESRRDDFGGERRGEGRHHGEGEGRHHGEGRGEGRGGYGDRY